MKKALKILLLISGVFIILILGITVYFLTITANVNLDTKKLQNTEKTITYYDINGNVFYQETSGVFGLNFNKLPKHVKDAFIAIEDKRFYSHNGIDYRGLIRALVSNVKSFSFKEGGSTITQQLIKNTHLSGEKTLIRKIKELKLARELEKKYTKDEIIEKYLNTIYFGEGCYGISSASKFYFNKTPEDLSLNESCILASIIKAPSYYSPIKNKEKCNNRKNLILEEMYSQKLITKEDLVSNKNSQIQLNLSTDKTKNYEYIARKQFNNVIENFPYEYKDLKIYTFYDENLQKTLKDYLIQNEEYNNSLILQGKQGEIIAYSSTYGDLPRQVGSTIKPILVYAPCIENEIVYSCSPINDEKTSFNGYSPSNYNDKYYGYVSVKESLAKSLNVCSVKLLNELGVDNAKKFINKTDIKLSDKDNSLCIALGATENGIKLSELVSSYNVFLNNGDYYSPSCISKIIADENNVVYQKDKQNVNIFSSGTIDVLNDMLSYTVTDGTAKKLSYSKLPLYAKTGTVGNEKGNTDAYTISYCSDYILGAWCGNVENTLMDNTVTGGNVPAKQSVNIWELVNRYKKIKEIEKSKNSHEDYYDINAYKNEHKVILADLNAPFKTKEKSIFKNTTLKPTRATTYSYPIAQKPKISVFNNRIEIELCLTEYCNAIVYKHENNKKTAVHDTADNGLFFIDENVMKNQKYYYSIHPYYVNNDKTFWGKEILTNTIKIPNSSLTDEWWEQDFD